MSRRTARRPAPRVAALVLLLAPFGPPAQAGAPAPAVHVGAPVFEVAAGEAVYAGSYSADHALPVMDLDLARSAFPELSAVPDKIRPASWTNGARGKCVGSYLYALEIPGQPFVDGYGGGSRAWMAAGDGAPRAAAQ